MGAHNLTYMQGRCPRAAPLTCSRLHERVLSHGQGTHPTIFQTSRSGHIEQGSWLTLVLSSSRTVAFSLLCCSVKTSETQN